MPLALLALAIGAFGIGTTEFVIAGLLPRVAGDFGVSIPTSTEVDEEANVVYVSRHMDDAECPPFYYKSTGIEGRITRWQDVEYHAPCLYLLHSRIAPVGILPPE